MEIMEGVNTPLEYEDLKNSIHTIGANLYQGGFELEEIEEYFRRIVHEVLITHVL